MMVHGHRLVHGPRVTRVNSAVSITVTGRLTCTHLWGHAIPRQVKSGMSIDEAAVALPKWAKANQSQPGWTTETLCLVPIGTR